MEIEKRETTTLLNNTLRTITAIAVVPFSLSFLEPTTAQAPSAPPSTLVHSSSIEFHEVSPVTKEQAELMKLDSYLSSIRPDKARLLKIIEENDVFAGFKTFTTEQRIEDFKIYYPIYRAAEKDSQIPWSMVWLIHAAETAVSRNIGNTGAMQMDPGHKQLDKNINDWEFLSHLPGQRYPDDWREILKGARFIRNVADSIKKTYIPQFSDEDAILEAITYKYSAEEFGRARVRQYQKIKPLLDYPK